MNVVIPTKFIELTETIKVYFYRYIHSIVVRTSTVHMSLRDFLIK